MKNLRRLRRDAGMTQYGLAAATGIHRWRISHAELGLLKLTPEEIALVSKTLVNVSRRKSARVVSDLGNSRRNAEGTSAA
jgi:DNA-binding XRE family transcriptional regulator